MISRRYLLLIALIPVIIGVVLVLSYWVYRARSQARLWVYPARNLPQETPAAYGLPTWETVTFTNGAGLELVGWLIEPLESPNGQTVILVHGLSGHRGGCCHEQPFWPMLATVPSCLICVITARARAR